MPLSLRLQTILNMIEKESIVADIGCDHGLLGIALIEQEIAHFVYACDIKPAPLANAKKNIDKAQIANRIKLCLSCGLQKVESDVNCIVIAGMGFDTIKMILETDLHKVKQCKKIIIQSNTHVEALRKWIDTHGFVIDTEALLLEDKHFYQVIAFTYKNEHSLNQDPLYYYIGGQQIRDNIHFHAFLQKLISQQQNILSNMPKNFKRYSTHKKMLEQLKQLQ